MLLNCTLSGSAFPKMDQSCGVEPPSTDNNEFQRLAIKDDDDGDDGEYEAK